VGIGILKTNAGIGIPASVIPVRYRMKKCRTAAFYSGTGPFTASLVFEYVRVSYCPASAVDEMTNNSLLSGDYAIFS
jgi:hypothetical protein